MTGYFLRCFYLLRGDIYTTVPSNNSRTVYDAYTRDNYRTVPIYIPKWLINVARYYERKALSW